MRPNFLSSLLCGFRASNGTEDAVLRFAESCTKLIDNRGIAGAVLTNPSKASDCVNHELLNYKIKCIWL